MSRMRLIDLLSHPHELDEKTFDMLKEALDAYPFFQAGRMLWVKNLHKLDHIRYNSELKLAAAFIPDRSKLFFLINDVFSFLSAPDENEIEGELNELQDLPIDKGNDDKKNEVIDNDEKLQISDTRVNYPLDEGLSRVVGSEANYFEVDDAITSATGEVIDFSFSSVEEEQIDQGKSEKNEGELFSSEGNELRSKPSDLLDYEKKTYSSSYSIEEDVPPTPLDFNENHSFSEWLNLLKDQPAQRPVEKEKPFREARNNPKKAGMDLIENFLNSSGSEKRILPREEKDVTNEDFSAKSVVESEDLMTETLANIHIKQKRYQKAIDIFERLNLKYPEKSIYFARRIKEMEDLINNQ